MSRQFIASDEAIESNGVQHMRPCSDCPFARTALKGWLGGDTVDQWIQCARSESVMECHVLKGAQCAGAAIYRTNICKSTRNEECLRLPADELLVFGFGEFEEHHRG